MRAIIGKCHEKAAVVKEEQQKRVLQQMNLADLYYTNLNTNVNGNHTDTLSSYLSQKLLPSNQYQENLNPNLEIPPNSVQGYGSNINSVQAKCLSKYQKKKIKIT